MVLCLSFISPMMCPFHGTLEENMWSGKIAIGRGQQIHSLRHRNLFLLLSLSCWNISIWIIHYNGIWMGRQYCWHWTIAFNWQKSQYREWILKHCFGWEWTLSIELPMSWKGEGNLVLIFDIFEVLRKDTLLLICQRMRVGFRNNSSDWSLALICKYLDFDSWECLLERLLRFVNVSMRGLDSSFDSQYWECDLE